MSETEQHLCARCGRVAQGYAWGALGERLCHTSDPETDCYSKARTQKAQAHGVEPE
jgi:hypothetical protein